MKRIDFYKELYFQEHDRKKSLNDALALPVGVVTGQIGLLYYFYNSYISEGFNTIPKWTTIIFFTTVICLLVCIAFLIYSYFELKFKKKKFFIDSAFDYRYLDLTINYEKFFSQSLAYYDETSQTENSKTEIDFEENLIKNLVESNDHNIYLNDIKTGRLWKAKLFLVIALLLNFSLLTYPFLDKRKINNEQKIKIN